jgi:hypothetical protein
MGQRTEDTKGERRTTCRKYGAFLMLGELHYVAAFLGQYEAIGGSLE